MAQEPEGTLITLLDDEGKEHEFEHLATLEYNEESYVALVPSYETPAESLEGDGELVILKVVTDENGDELLASIEDDTEFEAVAKEFEKLLDDEYEISEDIDE
jgi:uncharacterized protein YrzB (UPF0473 family)